MADLLEAALAYAAEGVAVFPCKEDKSPRVAEGFKAATTDPDVIRSWDWNGMIGAAIPEGMFVLDVDPRNGGNETMKALRAGGLSLPNTKLARTMSGGRHHWFTTDVEELRNKVGAGVDVKRHGKGYVIVPPSPGYEWTFDREPAPAPSWLTAMLRGVGQDNGDGVAASAKYFEQFENGTAYGRSALERELGRLSMAGEGDRNNQLNKSAFALAQLAAGGELDEGVTRDRLAQMALSIGLEPEETAKTIDSGWRDGLASPRQAPEVDAGDRESSSPQVFSVPSFSFDEEEDESQMWADWDVDEPTLPYMVEPLLPEHCYILVYGPTEASKSMVWLGICVELSHHGWHTSFYSLENPPHTDRSRLRRLKPDKRYFRLTNRVLDLNDTRQLTALVRREKENGTHVIVLDTYSHAFGSHSDDGNAKAIDFARRVRWIMQEVGCSVVVIDHTGYSRDDEPRDASAKRQQVDVAVLMRKVGDWSPGKAAAFSLENKKAARFGNPFFVRGEIRDTADKGLELAWTHGNLKWEAA